MKNRVRPFTLVILGLTIAAANGPRVASAPYLETSFYWQNNASLLTTAVKWADLNNDGLLDLTIANLTQQERIYINSSAGLPVSHTYTNHLTLQTQDIDWGDVDGDGDLDLACATVDGYENIVWFNTGNGSLEPPPDYWESADGGNTTSITWVDFDLDGDLDLCAGKYGAPVVIYLNNNGALASIPAWVAADTKTTSDIAWARINSDAYPDLVCANYGQPNTLFLSTGTGPVSTTPIVLTNSAHTSSAVAIGDVDADGDMDIIFANEDNNPNTLYLNPGDGFTGPVNPSWSYAKTYATTDVLLADFENDDDLDIIFINKNYFVQIFENNQGFGLTPIWESSASMWGAAGAVADVDADGDLEITVGIYGNYAGIFRNIRPILDTAVFWQSTRHNNTYGVDVGDINNDGLIDLAFANQIITPASDQGLTIYRNAATSLPVNPTWSSDESLTYQFRSLRWADIYHDRFPELFAASEGNPLIMFANSLGFVFRVPDWTAESLFQTRGLEVLDLNQDGYSDIFLGNYGESLAAFIMDLESPGALPVEVTWTGTDAIYANALAGFDFDADGDVDLAVACDTGSSGDSKHEVDFLTVTPGANLLYQNQDRSLEAEPTWQSDDTNDTSSCTWGDVDSDGYAELVCANANGSIILYDNLNGTLDPHPSWQVAASGVEFTQVILFDLDFDGDLDLLAAADQAPTRLYRNDNGVLSTTPGWQTAQTNLRTLGIGVGDFDDDGDKDIVLGNYDQPNMIFRNPLMPTSLLPNNPTAVMINQPNSYSTGTIDVTFTLFDNEYDPCTIVPLYSTTRGGTWVEATGVSGQVLVDLATSPSGVVHHFLWDTDVDEVNSDEVLFKIVAFSHAGHWGNVLHPPLAHETLPFRVQSAPKVTLLAPEDDQADNAELLIRYHVTEAIAVNNTRVTFDWVSGQFDNDHAFSALLSPAPAGIYQVMVNAEDLNDDGSYTTDDHLVNGAIYDVHITVSDATGNSGTDVNRRFRYDNQPPTSQIASPTDGQAFTSRQITLTGTATDGALGSGLVRVVVRIDGLPFQAQGLDTWSLQWTALMDGTHTAQSLCYDLAGNIETAVETITFHIDSEAPAVLVTEPELNSCVSSTSYTIRGTAADSVSGVTKVQLDFGSGWRDAVGTTAWSYPVSLPDPGVIGFEVKALDVAGNESEPLPWTFIVDRESPEVAITSPAAGQTMAGTPLTVAGTSIDSLSSVRSVELRLDEQAWVTASDLNTQTGIWGHSFPNVSQGNHTLTARSVDQCDNATAEADYARVSFKVDTEPPFIQLGGYFITDLQADESGTITMIAYIDRSLDPDIESVQLFAAGESLGIYLNDTGTSGDFAAGDGLFTFQLSNLECLGQMQFYLELQARDKAGNSSALWPYLHCDSPPTTTFTQSTVPNYAVLSKLTDTIQRGNRPNLGRGTPRPFIAAAGYMATSVSQAQGGTITMWAIALDAAGGCAGVDSVELYYAGAPTGINLTKSMDCVYVMDVPLGPEQLPGGDYLLEFRARETTGALSDIWPYVYIHEESMSLYPRASKYTASPFEPIQFSANIDGGVYPYSQFNWRFGDGAESREENPLHAYSTEGQFHPNLTVIDCLGRSINRSLDQPITITTCEGFALGCSADASQAELGQEIQFHADAYCGNPPYGYYWNFGDGTSSTEKDPRKSFSAVGTYQVCVTATDASQQTAGPCCMTITIGYQDLTCSSTVDKQFAFPDEVFHFSATASGGKAPYTYDWRFGDGSTGNGAEIEHAYSSPGSYDVAVVIRDAENTTCEPPVLKVSVDSQHITDHVVEQNGSLVISKVWLQDVKSGDLLEWIWVINGQSYSHEIRFGSPSSYVEDTMDLVSIGADPDAYSGRVELRYNSINYPQWTKTLPP